MPRCYKDVYGCSFFLLTTTAGLKIFFTRLSRCPMQHNAARILPLYRGIIKDVKGTQMPRCYKDVYGCSFFLLTTTAGLKIFFTRLSRCPMQHKMFKMDHPNPKLFFQKNCLLEKMISTKSSKQKKHFHWKKCTVS